MLVHRNHDGCLLPTEIRLLKPHRSHVELPPPVRVCRTKMEMDHSHPRRIGVTCLKINFHFNKLLGTSRAFCHPLTLHLRIFGLRRSSLTPQVNFACRPTCPLTTCKASCFPLSVVFFPRETPPLLLWIRPWNRRTRGGPFSTKGQQPSGSGYTFSVHLDPTLEPENQRRRQGRACSGVPCLASALRPGGGPAPLPPSLRDQRC